MKTLSINIYTATCVLSLLLTASCTKSLNLEPISNVSIDKSYQSENDINQAIAGAYNSLKSPEQYGSNMAYYAEIRSDNSELENLTYDAGVYANFELFRLTANNKVLNETWTSLYSGIQSCNIILNRIDEVNMAEADRTVRSGEAKFIRALSYFNLVRVWGDVPLVLTEIKDPFEAFDHTRTPQQQVYEQIIKDLKEAAVQLMPAYGSTEVGRATTGAANTLIGKVYLTLKQYGDAATILKQVIDSKTYKLLSEYDDVFAVENKNNVESIFEIQYKSGGLGQGSTFANEYIPQNSNSLVGGVGNALGNNEPTTDLYNAYDPQDKRRDMIGVLADGRKYSKKYIETLRVPNDGDRNSIVLRYADVLLMYAEALNELGYDANGLAFDYVNELRLRTGLGNVDATVAPDQESFRLMIERERRLELSMENHRWFDLARTGRTLAVMNQHVSSNGKVTMTAQQVLFPVPLTQIDASSNKLTQNDGYN